MRTFSVEQELAIVKEYTQDELSTSFLAKKYRTNPKRIGVILKKHGVKLRDKSEAQSLALKHNRAKHPTKGTVRDESTKLAISEKLASSWNKISQEEYDRRVENSRERWNNIPIEDREEMTRAGCEAIRVASKEGSKLEKYVCEKLEENGIKVLFHKKGLIINDNLELDLFVPSAKAGVEIDGPSHYFPIWGEEKFKKHIQADQDKNTLLLKSGYSIVRVKNIEKNNSQSFQRKVVTKLLEVLVQLQENKEPQCIMIDVGDN